MTTHFAALPLAEFAEQAAPVLAADPARANVVATLLAQHRDQPPPDEMWILISEGGRPVAGALATGEGNLMILPIPPQLSEPATAGLARLLRERERPVRRVHAQGADTVNFARTWSGLSGAEPGPEKADVIYEIRRPPGLPEGVAGAAREAGEDDVPRLVLWMAGFQRDLLAHLSSEAAEDAVRRRMRHGRMFVWEDGGEPVSMAGLFGPVAGVSRVGVVYTPPERRRHGYGSAVTAATTRRGFADGAASVVLHAEHDNATSNHVYQALGYESIGSASIINFSR